MRMRMRMRIRMMGEAIQAIILPNTLPWSRLWPSKIGVSEKSGARIDEVDYLPYLSGFLLKQRL